MRRTPVPSPALITSLAKASKSCKPATFSNSWSTTVDRLIRSNACGLTADDCRVPPDDGDSSFDASVESMNPL